MALIDDVKRMNRVTTNADSIVGQLEFLIGVAKAELQRVGIPKEQVDDPDDLVKMAIVLYTRAHFGLDNPERESFQQAFLDIQNAIRLSLKSGDTP